jgi:hypothetical protein
LYLLYIPDQVCRFDIKKDQVSKIKQEDIFKPTVERNYSNVVQVANLMTHNVISTDAMQVIFSFGGHERKVCMSRTFATVLCSRTVALVTISMEGFVSLL